MATMYSKFQKIFTIAISALLLAHASIAADDEFQNDWIIKLKTEKENFQFPANSRLNDIAKITVEYAKQDDPDKKTLYQLMWFADGKPIGLERKNQFEITPGQTAAMEVTHKKGSSGAECKATADAILRLSLTAFHNKNPIVSIKVPPESYDDILTAMESLNCVDKKPEVEKEHDYKLSFAIESDVPGKETLHKTLYFY